RHVKRPTIWRRNQRDLYVGSEYAVHCTAFVGTGGEIRFRLADSVNETYIVESGDYRGASVTFETGVVGLVYSIDLDGDTIQDAIVVEQLMERSQTRCNPLLPCSSPLVWQRLTEKTVEKSPRAPLQ
ncbi:hypothetical protein ElyMa_000632600, partial [Elysia marginata]